MGSLLSKPLTAKNIESLQTPSLQCGSAEMHGCRIAMEDAHILREIPHVPGGLIVGVFDGHNGAECSEFIAKKIENAVLTENSFPIAQQHMHEIVMKADISYLDAGGEAGSTGVFALLYPKLESDGSDKTSSESEYKMEVVNVGDSRALMWKSKTNSCVSITTDHKPNTPSERHRIEASGGHVSVGRVNGDLAVSRAFGDFQFKNNKELPMESQAVTTVPDMFVHDFEEGDILIVACDGVFESNFSNEEVSAFVADTLDESGDPSWTACRVVDEAFHRGSKDNISCTIVWNKPTAMNTPGIGEKKSFAIPGSYLPLVGNGNPGYRDAFDKMCSRGGVNPTQMIKRRYEMLKAATGRADPDPSWDKLWEIMKDTCSPEEGFEELEVLDNLIESCDEEDRENFFSSFWEKRGMMNSHDLREL